MRRPPQWTEFGRYPITAGTIVLAAIATVAWFLKVDISPLLSDPHVGHGQLWRLVTSVFPHVNIIHLAFNVAWVWTFGSIVESAFGSARMLAILLFFAVCSSAAEYAFLDGGVGLSGVVYGLFGLLWVLHRCDARFTDAMDVRVVQLFIGWFFLCIILTVADILPVGNIAHGVGAICGVTLGWCITQRSQRMLATIALSICVLTLTLCCAVFVRPYINFSSRAGADEAGLGYAALEKGNCAEAIAWYREATKLSPREPTSWYDMGIAYHKLNRYPEALAAYKRAHELSPQDTEYEQAYQRMDRAVNHNESGGFMSSLVGKLVGSKDGDEKR